jgi:hypothetical protein
LDDMKQSIVWVQTILNNISTKLQSTVAKTMVTMVEEFLKKGRTEENDLDWICSWVCVNRASVNYDFTLIDNCLVV